MNELFIYAFVALVEIIIYIGLASEFASFAQPLTIMASLLLMPVGTLTVLLLGSTRHTFPIVSFVPRMGS
ncbi:putative membrane protein [Paraburkholderia xenovorans LB400]|uniref:hypothetical protein n=1 Tax=Paraburkholderia xenovorans TaxID=36873 RepID=UPI000037DB03|nr:hypothetical protein [Paraburkholderia xenovorans]AIP33404.1 putative membrane protein [Paraburkholderia xenovorans LB400]